MSAKMGNGYGNGNTGEGSKGDDGGLLDVENTCTLQ